MQGDGGTAAGKDRAGQIRGVAAGQIRGVAAGQIRGVAAGQEERRPGNLRRFSPAPQRRAASPAPCAWAASFIIKKIWDQPAQPTPRGDCQAA